MPHRSHGIVTLDDLQTEVKEALTNAEEWRARVNPLTPVYVRLGRLTVPIRGLHVGNVDGHFAVILDVALDPAAR
jgi:hypothetical protein